jgi:SAM-dependent methyltransferase
MPNTQDPYAFSAGYYDLFLMAEDALPSVPFFAGLAPSGCRALEVGSGTGRVALAVAERAASVHCIEPSATMRAVLLSKLAARPELRSRVTVLPGAAPTFALGRRFDYAYLAGVLEHVPHAQRGLLFATIADHLDDGGMLAMDMVLDSPVPDFPEQLRSEVTVGECRYVLSCEIRPVAADQARLRFIWRTYLAGEMVAVEEIERAHMLHRRADVLLDLKAAGFEPVGGGVLDGPATEPDGRADYSSLVAVRTARA